MLIIRRYICISIFLIKLENYNINTIIDLKLESSTKNKKQHKDKHKDNEKQMTNTKTKIQPLIPFNNSDNSSEFNFD